MNNLIKRDIRSILLRKTIGKPYVYIHEKNRKFFEEILRKGFSKFRSNSILDSNEISEEDITTLQEYLDYIHMIEE